MKGISSLCTTTIALDGFNWDEVDTKLQILGFGGRDAGDATAVSYINYDTTTNDATYRFATLYDGFTDDGMCSLEEMCDDKCQAGISGIIGRYIPLNLPIRYRRYPIKGQMGGDGMLFRSFWTTLHLDSRK